MTPMTRELRCLLDSFWLQMDLMAMCGERAQELERAGLPVKGDPTLSRLLRVTQKARVRFTELRAAYRCAHE